MTSAADLDRIIDGPGTKADRARALFALGCDRTDVVELLGMNYSQAHSIYVKGLQNGSSRSAAASQGSSDSSNPRSGKANAYVGPSRGGRSNSHRYALQLSPSQTRVATQDGHQVIKLDRESGVVCRNCEEPLIYSIRWLAFIHTFSKQDPTDLEDYYAD